jgi:hypothetical protein
LRFLICRGHLWSVIWLPQSPAGKDMHAMQGFLCSMRLAIAACV